MQYRYGCCYNHFTAKMFNECAIYRHSPIIFYKNMPNAALVSPATSSSVFIARSLLSSFPAVLMVAERQLYDVRTHIIWCKNLDKKCD